MPLLLNKIYKRRSPKGKTQFSFPIFLNPENDCIYSPAIQGLQFCHFFKKKSQHKLNFAKGPRQAQPWLNNVGVINFK